MSIDSVGSNLSVQYKAQQLVNYLVYLHTGT